VKCHLSQIFWSTLWTRSPLTTDGQPLRSSSWTLVHLPIFKHSTPLSYSSFTHYILAINCCWFTIHFHSTHVLSVEKADNTNFSAGGIISYRTHSVGTRTNTKWPFMWWFTRHMSRVTLPHMHERSFVS
jgi:hypothetical protein